MKNKPKTTNPKNAGRKKVIDLKDSVVLMVNRSYIVGKDNLDIPIKDPSGGFTQEYTEARDKLKAMLYETIEFNAAN